MIDYRPKRNHKVVFYLKYYFLLLLLISQAAFADCDQASDICAPVGEWEFSLSVGAGVTTNPLNGGDNIPLILVPEISFYGEKVFFENSTLGYTFFERDPVVVSAITKLNSENAYFYRWHPQNIFLNSTSSSQSPSEGNTTDSSQSPNESEDLIPGNELIPNDERTKISIDDVGSKRWAIDAGIQLNWFINDTTDLKIQLLHDINQVYNGFNGQIELSKFMLFKELPDTVLFMSLGATLQSEALVDYFYGVPAEDELSKEPLYRGEASVNPYVRFELIHQFSQNWSAKLNIKRIALGKGITNSPLVKDDSVNTIFAGVTYDF